MPDSRRQHRSSSDSSFPSFGDARRRDLFLRLVREHLGRSGRAVRIRGDRAEVEDSSLQYGLTNIAQICSQVPTDAWPALVAEHLDRSNEDHVHAIAGDLLASRFDQVEGRLAVRIYPEEYLPAGHGRSVVHRTDLPGTVSVLVLDLPASVVAIPAPVAAGWAVAAGALFERALQNVAGMGPTDWQSFLLPPPPGIRIDFLACNHCYTTSHVLRLDQCLQRAGRFGNLIAVPHRGILLSFPIDDAATMHAVEGLLQIATGMFRDGPGSISPHLYWRTPDGRFLMQQGIVEGDRIRLAPSGEFLELMQRLRAPGT